MKQLTIRIPESKAAFWKRKKTELKRQSSDESAVTDSSMFEALLSFWQAMDAGDVPVRSD
tara:strand:- start:148 stop:327 length:180 start_codon:yes stop_codon:yes gene_type:complete